MSKEKDGFDSKKRMGNSAQRGVGVNSPAMMEARKGFSKPKQSTSDGYMVKRGAQGQDYSKMTSKEKFKDASSNARAIVKKLK